MWEGEPARVSPRALHLLLVARWLAGAPALGSDPTCPGLLELAEQEGTLGIIAAMLPGDPARRQRQAGYWGRGLWQMAFLERLGSRLEQQDLEVIALKGAALIPTAYVDPLLRPMGDLDLLVGSRDLQRVQSLLESFGPDRPQVDLHTELLDTRRIPSRRLLGPPTGALWADSRPWRPGLRLLSEEHQLLHLSLHALKHSCCRLIWLVDLALALRCCPPARIPLNSRPVLFCAHLVTELFPCSAPLVQLPPLAWSERMFLRVAARRRPGPIWGELFLAASLPGLSARLRYLVEYGFLGDEVVSAGGPRLRLAAAWRRFWRFVTNPRRNRGDAA
ncbi:MAG: hypothetical protein AMXMBFR33_46210 [Candidatus Xenobia bacterium]